MIGMTTSGLPLTDVVSFGWAAELVLKTSLLLAITGVLTLALARSSAALRHLLWSLAVVGVLAMPAIPLAVPWAWEVLPQWVMSSGEATEPVPQARAAEAAISSLAVTTPATVDSEPSADVEGKRLADAAPRTAPVTTEAGARASTPFAVLLGALALFGWAVVALGLLVHQLVGRLALGRITRDAEPVDDPDLRWELAWALGLSSVSRPVRLLRSLRAKVPMTWGVRTPVVLLPAESRDWSPERVRLVLHHELAHVRRLDAMTDAVARVACALHWFNPLVWWASARLRSESEKAADDIVLRGGARASDYAGHLLALVTQLGSRRAPAGGLPLAQRSTFEGRLLAILDPSRRRTGVGRLSAVALGTTLVALVVGLGSVAPAQAAVGQSVVGAEEEEIAEPLAPEPGSTSSGTVAQTAGDVAPAIPAAEPDASIRPEDTVDRPVQGGPDRATEDVEGAEGAEVGGGVAAAIPPVASEKQAVDTTSVRALTQALAEDSNAEVRRTAAWALGQLEDRTATPALVQALREDASVEVRRMVAWAMGQVEDPAAAPALGDALADDDPEVRETALWALGQIEAPEAVGPLSRALSDPDPHVRKTAAWALGQIESPEAVGPLAGALDDEDVDVRSQVVWALGQIESRDAVEPLGRALSDAEPEVRRQAAWALGQIESAAAVDALARALRDDSDTDVRRQAAWALGQIEADAGVPALAEALSDSDGEVARMAAWALGQIEPRSAPPELIEAARSGTGELRTTALWALVRIEDPAAVPALVDALQDPDGDVRARALRGLAQIGSDVAIEAIATLLQDPDPEVRAAAARALARGGGGYDGAPNPNPNPDPDPRPRPRGGVTT